MKKKIEMCLLVSNQDGLCVKEKWTLKKELRCCSIESKRKSSVSSGHCAEVLLLCLIVFFRWWLKSFFVGFCVFCFFLCFVIVIGVKLVGAAKWKDLKKKRREQDCKRLKLGWGSLLSHEGRRVGQLDRLHSVIHSSFVQTRRALHCMRTWGVGALVPANLF